MKELCPGLNPARLVVLMREAVKRCELDLSGSVVLTEAASGAYIVTPILAALSGAGIVYAFTRSSRYGTVEKVAEETLSLSAMVGLRDRIKIITKINPKLISRVDIVTNSGHLRPLSAEVIGHMKPGAVIPLMYEAWELRESDVDLSACRRHGIAVAGTNERHPSIDVFSFLGIMAVKLLLDAGVSVYSNRVLLLCDNPFKSFIERGLLSAGARVDKLKTLSTRDINTEYDAILVALKPCSGPVLTGRDAAVVARTCPTAVVAQFWGDIDRSALSRAGVQFWPVDPPPPGHMGIIPSEVGPEPVIRLQAGGLKVGELLLKMKRRGLKQSEIENRVKKSGYVTLLS